jgi:hypothetical protein
LAIKAVGIEKLVFRTNNLKSGDGKCPPGPRKSFVGPTSTSRKIHRARMDAAGFERETVQ